MLNQTTPHAPVRYIRWKGNNFGDNINDVLFQEVFGIRDSVANVDPLTDGVNLLGIGTLLNSHLKLSDTAALWVIGSGAGNTPAGPKLTSNNLIFFVRGPLTCQYYNLPANLAVADSAYLLADKFRAAARSNPLPSRRFGIIPNYWSIDSNPPRWQQVSQRALVIDPHLDWQAFIQQVNSCEVILTECLHGAIAADILRKPFIVFATTPLFHAFKWLDWASSMDLPLNIRLFNFNDPEELVRTQTPILSKPQTLNRVLELLEHKKAEILHQLENLTTAPVGN
jgi:pyruvyltransferase